MKSFYTMGAMILSSRSKSLVLAGMVAIVLAMTGGAVRAKDNSLAKEDLACLTCHDKAGMEKKLSNGESLSLQISTQAYTESMHKDASCEDCHSDLDAKTHGKTKADIKSKRAFSLSMREACRTCHAKKFTEYEGSVHAALITQGSKEAPLCSDCHNPHTVRSVKIPEPITATPCAKCHADIFKAYSQSVHGQARTANVKSAPICSDCHQAHAVKAASLGTGVKDACLGCHKNAVTSHQEWLPNAELHFEAISCPACHAPTAERRVNLRIFYGVGKQQVAEKVGVPKFEKRTDAADSKEMGLDERALWSLLKDFNQDGGDGKMVLRGRLEVRSGVQAHQLSEKSKALKDCNICHKEGAAAFQSVSLTIAGPDGRPLRHGIQKDVLNSLTSMDSVRGFYTIGSTRIKLLDTLLVLVLLGAISVPLGHMTVKRLFKNMREKLEAERAAAPAQAASHTTPGAQHTDKDASK